MSDQIRSETDLRSPEKAVRARSRSRTVAGLLNLISPFVSFLYLGRPRRAFIYLGAVALSLAIPMAMASIGLWISGVSWWVLFPIVIAVAILDSVRIAARHEEPFDGPWYTRWHVLTGVSVILLVMPAIIQKFYIASYHISSNGMMPTLLVGDQVFASPYSGDPQIRRGDVIVFDYPPQPSTLTVKRVVGLPGDSIAYYEKTLYVNGTIVEQVAKGSYVGARPGSKMTGASLRAESLGGRTHEILIQSEYPSVNSKMEIPAGQLFVLGDNRDNSRDSRHWATVPMERVVGRVVMIWWNTDLPRRAGTQLN